MLARKPPQNALSPIGAESGPNHTPRTVAISCDAAGSCSNLQIKLFDTTVLPAQVDGDDAHTVELCC